MGVDLGQRTRLILVSLVGTAGLLPGAALAATLKVNTTRDELRGHDGRCSLREALATVNAPGRRTDCGRASRQGNVIVLGPRPYRLTIAPAGGDDNATGDLNLTGSPRLTIRGVSPGATVIDARGLGDRVLSIAPGASVTLLRVRITGGAPLSAQPGAGGVQGLACALGGAGADGADAGSAGSGGGIMNSGRLSLQAVVVTGNTAAAGGAGGAGSSGCGGGDGGQGGSGGGIYNRGRLSITDSTIDGNRAGSGGSGGAGADAFGTPGADGQGGAGGAGGGIFSAGGRVRVINSTLAGNLAGAGGRGGGLGGSGGAGGDGGAIAIVGGAGVARNATVAANGVGSPGAGGPAGAKGVGGGLFVEASTAGGSLRLLNTIVASSAGSACAGTSRSAIVNGGHDLSFGDRSCPGRTGNPRLGPLKNNGGLTKTMALGARSAAIGGVPRRGAGCPGTDQRGVRRPQRRGCDIGAFEFAVPKITIASPFHRASYEHGFRIVVHFHCGEGGVASVILTCHGTVPRGRRLTAGKPGAHRFVVTAVDKSGNRTRKTIRYTVWEYVNPLREVSGLYSRRIDLGVDYGGWGPLLALGDGLVTMASNTDSGPSSCWAVSCWPGGGVVVYRLLDGPFAGKYVYVAEHLTVNVRRGQRVRAGQRIATLYSGYPWSEWGWAAGPGPEALGIADGHQCPCGDPGGWSTIEGRNFNQLLVRVGAPSGLLQPNPPNQSMPAGWPTWSG